MKTTTDEESTELAQHVSEMQNDNNLWLYKRTRVFITIVNFVAVLCAAAGVFGYFVTQQYMHVALAVAVFLFCANDFMQEGNYYTIELPQANTKKLYKIGNVYFVGASADEAQLYAHMENIQGEIECIDECAMF